jgi:hypothetical protein
MQEAQRMMLKDPPKPIQRDAVADAGGLEKLRERVRKEVALWRLVEVLRRG